jgi:glycosyltransferase involved in cell wall biosynthesis
MERTLVSLLSRFRGGGLRHAVVTLRDAGTLSERLPAEVACFPIRAVGRSWSAGLELARVARVWNASVLHARGVGCWNDAILAGVLARRSRIVLGFHGLEASASFGVRHRRSAKWGLLLGARFASVSESGVRQLHNELHIPLDRIGVLRNGVCLESFTRRDPTTQRRLREELGLAEDAFVVGIVGSLTAVKRHDVLIDAAARVASNRSRIALLVVGEGPLRSRLERQARSAGIADRVRFAGRREDIAEVLSSIDLYVCSSASEGMSNALLEAMAAGLPIVTTDVGDNGLVLRDGIDGLVIEPGSAEALAGAIGTLISQPDALARLGTAARGRAGAFDLNRAAARYEAYYEALASDRPHPAEEARFDSISWTPAGGSV